MSWLNHLIQHLGQAACEKLAHALSSHDEPKEVDSKVHSKNDFQLVAPPQRVDQGPVVPMDLPCSNEELRMLKTQQAQTKISSAKNRNMKEAWEVAHSIITSDYSMSKLYYTIGDRESMNMLQRVALRIVNYEWK